MEGFWSARRTRRVGRRHRTRGNHGMDRLGVVAWPTTLQQRRGVSCVDQWLHSRPAWLCSEEQGCCCSIRRRRVWIVDHGTERWESELWRALAPAALSNSSTALRVVRSPLHECPPPLQWLSRDRRHPDRRRGCWRWIQRDATEVSALANAYEPADSTR